MRAFTTTTLLALLSTTALARTDLSGCTSSNTVVNGGASVLWYVPGSGEICEFLDCGGGRAPPKTTVPGCPQYHGTASYSPSYLPGYGPNAVASMTTSSAAASVTEILPTQTGLTGSAPLVVDTTSSAASSQVTGSSSAHSTITSAPTGVTEITGKSTATSSVSGSKASSAASAASSAATGAATALSRVGREAFGLAIGVAAGLAMF